MPVPETEKELALLIVLRPYKAKNENPDGPNHTVAATNIHLSKAHLWPTDLIKEQLNAQCFYTIVYPAGLYLFRHN